MRISDWSSDVCSSDLEVDQALFSLAGERALAINTQHAKRLPSWVESSIRRKMPLTLVATITRCMYGKRKLRANYVSLSSGMRERLLSPLAVVHDGRSEEHTPELQSLMRISYAVYCLKKQHTKTDLYATTN